MAACALACSAIGQGAAAIAVNAGSQSKGMHPSQARAAVARPASPAARKRARPPAQVLRYPDPGEPGWRNWVTYSKSEKNGEKEETYRIPGDAGSKYYEVYLYSGQGDESSDILNDKNNYVTGLGWYADLIGIRKTPQAITVFAFYFPGNDAGAGEDLGSYEIGRIVQGRAEHYLCTVEQETVERATRRHFGTHKQLVAAAMEDAPLIVDYLTSMEPQLERDHCTQGVVAEATDS